MAVKTFIPEMKRKGEIDFVVDNAENIAGGNGITESTANELFNSGVDVLTSGDHIFDQKETGALMERDKRILRPANYPAKAPGRSTCVVEVRSDLKVAVINVAGRVFMPVLFSCPFLAIDQELKNLGSEVKIILVDIHAEATSEKCALSWYLDGRVSAAVGSHTHIQTADERISAKGTACISDLGMTGPYDSVIGRVKENVLSKFVSQMPTRLEVAEGDVRLSGVVITVNDLTGRAERIERVHKRLA